MSVEFWESRQIKKSRKPHICEYCFGIIPKGSSCSNEKGKSDGDFCNYYLCNRCYDLLSSRKEPWVDGWDDYLGEFTEALFCTDIVRCPKCNSNSLNDFEFYDNMMTIFVECEDCGHHYSIELTSDLLLNDEKDKK